MSETKEQAIFSLDISTSASSFNQVLSDVQAIGKVVVTDFHIFKEKQVAEATGQKGKFLYSIQGATKSWLVGADTLAKLLFACKQKDVMFNSEKKLKDFSLSKSFSILKNAFRRQSARREEK